MLVPFLIVAVVGYLLGSLPFGYLVARAKGVNIFEVGSKSPGATNVRRVLGNGPGNLVLFLDVLKGALAASWALIPRFTESFLAQFRGSPNGFVFLDAPEAGYWLAIGMAGLLGALVGHSFSCFTKFRGGKSVATAAGGFIVLFPVGALIAGAVWILTAALTRYASLASMLAGVALTLAAWFLHQPPLLMGVSLLVAVFIIIRHRTNIARLLAGTESKMGRKNAAPSNP